IRNEEIVKECVVEYEK
ncbi:hypothetical protein SNEBB_000345, partial [Seison nebaliae]